MTIKGGITVVFHVDPDQLPRVRDDLQQVFSPENGEEEEAPIIPGGPKLQLWDEDAPDERIHLFEEALGGWSNPDQEPIFNSALTNMSAEIREAELVPYALVQLRFGIQLQHGDGDQDREDTLWNTPDKLLFISQSCKDFAAWLLDDKHKGDAETVTVLSQTVSQDELDRMREVTKRIQTADRDELSDLIEELPVGRDGPLGAGTVAGGHSHYRIGINLHAVVAPATSTWLRGPGWIVSTYEVPPSADGDGWGSDALVHLDPLGGASPESAFLESRFSGFSSMLASWNWLGISRKAIRDQRQNLLDLEDKLASPLLWPDTFASWSSIHRSTSELRRIVHELRSVHDEYHRSLQQTLEKLDDPKTREVWIPPKHSRDLPPEERRRRGPIYRAVDGFSDSLQRNLTSAEDAWEMAKSQKEDYSVRVQRFVGLAIVLLGVVELTALVIENWSEIVQVLRSTVA